MFALNENQWILIFVVLILVFMVTAFLALVLGMILSALGKEPIASRLIQFGAGSGAIFFFAILVAGAVVAVDIFSGILMVYFLVWWIFRKNKIILCPHCATRITAEKRANLLKFFGIRQPISCPSCGHSLVLSKWPWRIG